MNTTGWFLWGLLSGTSVASYDCGRRTLSTRYYASGNKSGVGSCCVKATGFAGIFNLCWVLYRITWSQINWYIFFFWLNSPQWAMASSFTKFLDHTQRCITVGRTPLDEGSAHRRDLYLTQHTQHSQSTNIHASGGIRTHILSRRAAADLRLRPRGHWNRHKLVLVLSYSPNYA
jgi:hypothetical protein